jgi:hypothetical protein
MNNPQNKFSTLLLKLEQKTNLGFVACVIGLFFLGLSMLFCTPSFDPMYHGKVYSELSKNPFDWDASYSLQYRILAPFLGFLMHLRGTSFLYLPLLFLWFWLSSVYLVFRKKHFTPTESLIMVSLLSFSCTLFIPLISPGYTDPVSYFFLFIAFFYFEDFTLLSNRIKSVFCFILALFNHESSLFLFPALLLYHQTLGGIKSVNFRESLRYSSIFLLGFLPYIAFRVWVSSNTTVEYTASFYFTEENIKTCLEALKWAPAGLFFTFKLFWIFPILYAAQLLRTQNYTPLILLGSMFVFSMLQLLIAYDVSRMLCLMFPLILYSAVGCNTYWGNQKFATVSISIVLLNLLLPSYFASKDGLHALIPIFINHY